MKRRAENSTATSGPKKARVGPCTSVRLPAHGYPLEHPFNKDGYRYILAEEDPHAKKEEEDDVPGRPIPPHLYRVSYPHLVYISLNDRSPQLKISDDRLSLTGDKGYAMARATHGVRQGCWYFEVTVDDLTAEGSACRLGWGQDYANLQTPLGFDRFGYSWRSKKGTVFHRSRGKHYSEGYGTGDVLGFLVELPASNKAPLLPPSYKDRALIKFKNFFHFEEKDSVEETEKKLSPCPGSKIVFFKNGVSEGVAFSDVCNGRYYPCFSLYRSAGVTVNFGPSFRHQPSDFPHYCPMSEAADLSVMEGALSDVLFHVELDLSAREKLGRLSIGPKSALPAKKSKGKPTDVS